MQHEAHAAEIHEVVYRLKGAGRDSDAKLVKAPVVEVCHLLPSFIHSFRCNACSGKDVHACVSPSALACHGDLERLRSPEALKPTAMGDVCRLTLLSRGVSGNASPNAI